MIFRVINIVVIGALVLAAAYVYRIKFDSTVQAEHLAKLRAAERTDAAAHSAAIDHLLPRLPSPTDIMRGRP